MKEMIWFNQLATITEHLDDHKLIIFCHMVKGSFTDLVLPLVMAFSLSAEKFFHTQKKFPLVSFTATLRHYSRV